MNDHEIAKLLDLLNTNYNDNATINIYNLQDILKKIVLLNQTMKKDIKLLSDKIKKLEEYNSRLPR